MSEREEPVEPLNSSEAALASLTPAAGGLNRDRLLFLAGRANATPRRGWLMPLALTASCLVSATFAGLWLGARVENGVLIAQLRQPSAPASSAPEIAPAVVKSLTRIANLARSEQKPDAVEPADPNGYLNLRAAVLKGGVEALPKSQGNGNSAPPLGVHGLRPDLF